MQIRDIKYVRRVYGCRDCEAAPVITEQRVQVIEKSTSTLCILMMLPTSSRTISSRFTVSKKC